MAQRAEADGAGEAKLLPAVTVLAKGPGGPPNLRGARYQIPAAGRDYTVGRPELPLGAA
jgi:hypothetical protein